MSESALETRTQPMLKTRYATSRDDLEAEPRIPLPCERLQVAFNRAQPNYEEDVAVITTHWGTVGGGLLNDTLRGTVETEFSTLWTGLGPLFHSTVQLHEFRWYDQRVWPTKSPLLRVTDVTDAPGTASGTPLPAQTAMSCTLETETRARWGRFYLPALTANALTPTTGRYDTGIVGSIVAAVADWLNVSKLAGAIPLVYSPRGGVGPPVFEAGSTQEVTAVRCDDIVDIIRSRRAQDDPYRAREIIG